MTSDTGLMTSDTGLTASDTPFFPISRSVPSWRKCQKTCHSCEWVCLKTFILPQRHKDTKKKVLK